jgi:hypothetical protein
MKLDKDTVVKNRFWILAGTAAVLTLVGWALMLFTVPGTVSAERAKVEKEWKKDKVYNQFKDKDEVQRKKKEADDLKRIRDKIHTELYNSQVNDSFIDTWPKKMVDAGFDFKKGKFALKVAVGKKDAKIAAKSKGGSSDDGTQISGTLAYNEADYIDVKDNQGQVVRIMKHPHTKVEFAEGSDPKNPPGWGSLVNKNGYPVVVTYQVGRFFGEELTEAERRVYREFYKEQLPEVLGELHPVNVLKEPQVLLRFTVTGKTKNQGALKKELTTDGCWIFHTDKPPPQDNLFFNFVSKEGPGEWMTQPTDVLSEEVWAAQETLWVQRDLYKQLRTVNENLAKCVKDDKGSKDGWTKFRNYYWEIDLKVSEGKEGATSNVQAKLRNLRPQRQKINDLRFLLYVKDRADPLVFPPKEPKNLRFNGSAVDPAGSKNDVFPAADKTPDAYPLPGPIPEIVGVEQVLTPETAAVKRLDIVTVGVSPVSGENALSHFMFSDQVTWKPYKEKIKVPPKKGDKDVGKDDDPNKKVDDLLQPKTDEPQPGQDVNPDDIQDTDARKVSDFLKVSLNGLILERYLDKQAEYRKLPVAVSVIVGPEHLNRVEAALAGSPLRFLTTQVIWQRCMMQFGGAVQAAAKPGAAPAATGPGTDIQENIELTIYGMLTLYERPGRPPEPGPGAPPPGIPPAGKKQ